MAFENSKTAKALAASRKRAAKAPTPEPKRCALLAKSIVEQFPTDPTFPSIKISYLTNIQKYYVSIVRYKAIYGREGYALMKAHGETLDEAFSDVFNQWLNFIAKPTSATDELLAYKKGL
jgi:hypothetical protein